MRSLNLAAFIALGLAIGCWHCPAAGAQYVDTGAEATGDENPYGSKGTFEFGGSVATSWTPSLFELDIKPQAGWFIADRVELSAIVSFGYENEADGGERVSTQSGAFIVEPSYHLPLDDEESLFAFGGLGVGVGYDGDNPDFELIPRVGLNIEVGSRALLNPAIGMPILFGEKKGPLNDEFGVEAGFLVEVGVTTVL